MLNFKNINIISVFILAVLILLKIENKISVLWIVLLIVLWLIITIIGSFNIRLNYFLKANHCKSGIYENDVALTFDDGPNEKFTPKVLELLNKHKAKATFFCIGKNIEKYPKLFLQIINEGHIVGNHSYDHKNNFGFLNTIDVCNEIEKTQKIVKNNLDIQMKFFRPPFGITNPNIAKAVNLLNLETMGWSIRTFDTIAKNSEAVLKKIQSKIKKGDVILMHDNSELSIEVLEKLLVLLENKKLKSISLDKLFNIKAYE